MCAVTVCMALVCSLVPRPKQPQRGSLAVSLAGMEEAIDATSDPHWGCLGLGMRLIGVWVCALHDVIVSEEQAENVLYRNQICTVYALAAIFTAHRDELLS